MIYELRQYTMVPGRRDDFVDIFDRHFIESQEALGIRVVGQFRDLDRDDRYVWMRAYADMATRERALNAFYDGPVWAEHSGAANAMMTEWHDVLLLTPAWPGSGLAHDVSKRPVKGEAVAASKGITITIWRIEPETLASAVAAYRARAPEPLAAFRTEPSPNNYPRQPIRENETVLVGIRRGISQAAEKLDVAGDPIQVLRLAPTGRSLLR